VADLTGARPVKEFEELERSGFNGDLATALNSDVQISRTSLSLTNRCFQNPDHQSSHITTALKEVQKYRLRQLSFYLSRPILKRFYAI